MYLLTVWQRKTSLVFSLTLATLSVVAQTTKKPIDPELKILLFSTPHIGLIATPNMTEAAQVTKYNSDRYQMTATPQIGFEAGIRYALHLHTEWSLETGLRFGYAGRNTRYVILKEEFIPQAQYDIVQRGKFAMSNDPYASLPVLLEKRWFTKGRGYWSTALGANLRIHLSQTWEESAMAAQGSTWSYYYSLVFDTETVPKFWVNYNASAGYSWLLKNNNLLSLHLLTNYSPTVFVKGEYRFTLPNNPEESGSYQLKGSFLGLSASYMLTKANKKLKRLQSGQGVK
jgi:hypothetical protein